MSTHSAHDIANVFLKLSDEDSGDVLTNLKIQKLVYYAQGLYLALNGGEPLIQEDILAWQHGPVVESLYHELKQFGSSQVMIDEPLNEAITEDQRAFLGEVNSVYGQFSAWKLRDMTHQESPWLTTESGQVITHDKLSDYFKTQVR
jgi:uncharacterized phage-associated protein